MLRESRLSFQHIVRDAEDFLEEAEVELERAIKDDDRIRLREAAEKAWNAVVHAVNALAQDRSGRIPRSHHDRRMLLRELEKQDSRIERLALYDMYAARSKHLHGEAFYEGASDAEFLTIELEKASKLVRDVKKLLERKSS